MTKKGRKNLLSSIRTICRISNRELGKLREIRKVFLLIKRKQKKESNPSKKCRTKVYHESKFYLPMKPLLICEHIPIINREDINMNLLFWLEEEYVQVE